MGWTGSAHFLSLCYFDQNSDSWKCPNGPSEVFEPCSSVATGEMDHLAVVRCSVWKYRYHKKEERTQGRRHCRRRQSEVYLAFCMHGLHGVPNIQLGSALSCRDRTLHHTRPGAVLTHLCYCNKIPDTGKCIKKKKKGFFGS